MKTFFETDMSYYSKRTLSFGGDSDEVNLDLKSDGSFNIKVLSEKTWAGNFQNDTVTSEYNFKGTYEITSSDGDYKYTLNLTFSEPLENGNKTEIVHLTDKKEIYFQRGSGVSQRCEIPLPLNEKWKDMRNLFIKYGYTNVDELIKELEDYSWTIYHSYEYSFISKKFPKYREQNHPCLRNYLVEGPMAMDKTNGDVYASLHLIDPNCNPIKDIDRLCKEGFGDINTITELMEKLGTDNYDYIVKYLTSRPKYEQELKELKEIYEFDDEEKNYRSLLFHNGNVEMVVRFNDHNRLVLKEKKGLLKQGYNQEEVDRLFQRKELMNRGYSEEQFIQFLKIDKNFLDFAIAASGHFFWINEVNTLEAVLKNYSGHENNLELTFLQRHYPEILEQYQDKFNAKQLFGFFIEYKTNAAGFTDELKKHGII